MALELNNPLNKEQVAKYKSMSKYWDEVSGRGDRTPLLREAYDVSTELGVKLLWLVEDYLKLKENYEQLLKTSNV